MKKRKILGTTERPRLSTYRGLRNITAQLIDDTDGKTLAAATSVEKGLVKYGGNVAAAKAVGKLIAERALAAGIKKVVFDRGRSLSRPGQGPGRGGT